MKILFTFFMVFLAITISTKAQNVNIPDANFKSNLVANNALNTNSDTEIQVSEAQAFTGTILCAGWSISDLTGIEAFTALTVLDCSNNPISSLDVSTNTSLTSLNCASNQLAALNVSSNTLLTNLNCTDNNLTSLDLSFNTALTHLSVYTNDLTSLDLSQNSALTNLWCMFNEIDELDLSQNENLIFLQANHNLLTSLNLANGNNSNVIGITVNNNANLKCINVDDEVFSTTNWTGNSFSKDSAAVYSQNCASILCAITNVSVDNVLACDPATNSYTVTITTTFEEAGPADSLLIGGFGMIPINYPLTGSPQTETVTVDFDFIGSAAPNLSVSLWSSIDPDFSCINPGITGAWTPPDPCGALGVDEGFSAEFKMYPNPVGALLNIEVDENTHLSIVDLLGNIISKHQMKAGLNSIDINEMPSGVYYLESKNGNTQKFIKIP